MALEESLKIDSEADLRDLDKTIDRIDDVGSAMSDIESAGDAAERGTSKASGGLSSMIGWLGKAAGALGALGLAAGIGGAIMAGVNETLAWSNALNLMEAQTGATAAEIAQYKEIGQSLYTSGWGEGVDDVVSSISQVERITQASGDALRDLTEDAIIIRDAFGADIVESTRAADTLMNQFGIDGQRAFDLITVGFQRTGDPAGDLLDTFNEYSGNFSQMGFSAEMFLNLLNQGLVAGANNTDVVADAMREFNIRLMDGTSAEAFRSMGSEMSLMFDEFKRGDEDAAGFFEDMIGELARIEDPIKRNALGVQIFGTKWEDLGEDVLLALDPTSTAIGSFNELEGATDRAGNAMSRGLGPALENLKRRGLVLLSNFLEPFILSVIDKAVPAIEEMADFLEDDAAPAIDKFADAIGDKAGPAIEDITEFVGEAADKIGDFADTVQDFVAQNPMVLTYLKYFAIALGAIIAAAVVIPAIIGAVTAVIGGLGVVLGVVFSPIVLIAAALAALGLAYKENLFGFRDAVNEIAGVVGEAFGRIRDFVTGLIDAFKQGGLEGAGQFIQDKLITPILDAVRNVNWAEVVLTLWNGFKNALGVGLVLVWQAGAWTREHILQPIWDFLSNVNWGEVISTLWSNFKTVMTGMLALYWQASVWVRDHIMQPIWDYLSSVNWGEVVSTLWSSFKTVMTAVLALYWQAGVWAKENIIQPIWDYLSNVQWGEVLSTLWGNFKTMLGVALALAWQVTVWVKEKIIDPLVNAVTGVDWAGVITSIGDFGGTIFTKLKETLPDIGAWIQTNIIDPVGEALSGLAGKVKGLINDAIPDRMEIDFGRATIPYTGVGVDLGSTGVDIPNPFPGYASGTPWTGSGSAAGMAGVVHNREAVVPEGGMRVYPSKNGLMLDGAAQPIVLPITVELDGRVIYEVVKRHEGLRAT